MPDGSKFDGKDLLTLVRSGKSPFDGAWDANLLIQEIEQNLHARVVDILTINTGANFYGFHLKMSNAKDIVARLAMADLNMPNYAAFKPEEVTIFVCFEAAVYKLLLSEPKILASSLLYHRVPVQHDGVKVQPPQDISGRALFLFERSTAFSLK
ncbi:hypothetical protein H0H93_016496 [Arthromyces matolae]|nr:hypothetical protein H0H93_016496 [Arthromyces matolae]